MGLGKEILVEAKGRWGFLTARGSMSPVRLNQREKTVAQMIDDILSDEIPCATKSDKALLSFGRDGTGFSVEGNLDTDCLAGDSDIEKAKDPGKAVEKWWKDAAKKYKLKITQIEGWVDVEEPSSGKPDKSGRFTEPESMGGITEAGFEVSFEMPKAKKEDVDEAALDEAGTDARISFDTLLWSKKMEVVHEFFSVMEKHERDAKGWKVKDMGGDTVGAVATYTTKDKYEAPVKATVSMILPDKPGTRLEVEVVTKGDRKTKHHQFREMLRMPLDKTPFDLAEHLSKLIYVRISGLKMPGPLRW